MSLENKNSFNLEWTDTPLKDRSSNHGWSENANFRGKTYYKMFFNKKDNTVYLYDIIEDQYYVLLDGAKYRGYLIAFKLFKLNNNFKYL